MSGELCLRLFGKFVILIGIQLWQLGHEYKFQITAQDTNSPLLPPEEGKYALY